MLLSWRHCHRSGVIGTERYTRQDLRQLVAVDFEDGEILAAEAGGIDIRTIRTDADGFRKAAGRSLGDIGDLVATHVKWDCVFLRNCHPMMTTLYALLAGAVTKTNSTAVLV